MPGDVYIGTSGWSYDRWKDGFYAGVPRRNWFAHYCAHFGAVEVNATFYHSLKAATLESWLHNTPATFRFAAKAGRYLTHRLRLAFPEDALARERARLHPLFPKLAVVLWQLPASLTCDLDRLSAFAAQLASWPQTRHAIEFRHASWFQDDVAKLLADHAIASVQSDAADWPFWERITTDLVYVRLHGHTTTYVSRYAASALRAWAERIGRWRSERRDVHVYFDNTDAGHAVQNARQLANLLSGEG
ncbi:MAG: DUF72 domain-containing protein [Burkholderiales bacterium]